MAGVAVKLYKNFLILTYYEPSLLCTRQKCYNIILQIRGKSLVDNLFLILGAIFAIGMMVLMIKYAKFIHVQPKVEAERRRMKEERPTNLEENSKNNQ